MNDLAEFPFDTPPPPREVPRRIYDVIGGGFVIATAHFVLRTRRDTGRDDTHPGDPFGEVMAWLWLTNPSEAIALLRDYLAQLRYHDELATDFGEHITLDDVLDGVRASLPFGFGQDRIDALLGQARRELPAFFKDDITQP